MKIGIIGASAGTIAGGSETYLYQMGSQLSKRHEIVLFTGKGRGEGLMPHIRSAPFKVFTSFFISRKAPLNGTITRLFRLAFRAYVRTCDVESYSLYFSMLFKPKIRSVLEGCDAIVTMYFRDSILFSNYFARKGVPCVFCIPGDVHLGRFFKIDRSKMYLITSNTRKRYVEERYDVKVDGVVTPGTPETYLTGKRQEADKKLRNLLFVGRLDRNKGLDELLKIFEMLKERHPDLKLTIVGDGPERKRIENIIREKGFFGDVDITGQIPQSKIHSYYLNSTVMIHPSDIESFSMVVLEAMASGLPVVATDLPAIREASEGEVILLSKNDLNIWVDKISDLLEARAAREEMSIRLRRVAARHTWDNKSLDFENFLSRYA